MKKNLGKIDKIVRLIIAIVTVGLYFTGITSGTLGIGLMVVGGVLAATTLINFCPLYAIFKINTSKIK